MCNNPCAAPGSQVTLGAGLILAGWGKGKFREVTGDKPGNPESELSYNPTPDTLAILDGRFGTISDLLDYAKTAKPENVKMCYHTVKQEPNGEWKITQDIMVGYEPYVFF